MFWTEPFLQGLDYILWATHLSELASHCVHRYKTSPMNLHILSCRLSPPFLLLSNHLSHIPFATFLSLTFQTSPLWALIINFLTVSIFSWRVPFIFFLWLQPKLALSWNTASAPVLSNDGWSTYLRAERPDSYRFLLFSASELSLLLLSLMCMPLDFTTQSPSYYHLFHSRLFYLSFQQFPHKSRQCKQ